MQGGTWWQRSIAPSAAARHLPRSAIATRGRKTKGCVGNVSPSRAGDGKAPGLQPVEHAVFAPIGVDLVRDGEVNDVPALAEALTALFKSSGLGRRVRIGIANQRIMMRRIELPPLEDAGEIRQAVMFQAQDVELGSKSTLTIALQPVQIY